MDNLFDEDGCLKDTDQQIFPPTGMHYSQRPLDPPPAVWDTEGYRLAGEVFGRLRAAMPSGRVIMSQDYPRGPISFVWVFPVGNRHYSVADRIHNNLFRAMETVDSFVQKIIARWRREEMSKLNP